MHWRLANLRDARRWIPYVTAGDPFADITPQIMHGMAGGADVIEPACQFLDPMADGPVIQKAPSARWRAGIGMAQVLDAVRSFRDNDAKTPIVLMATRNPSSATTSATARARFIAPPPKPAWDGLLVVDYPPEECEAFAAGLQAPRHGPDLCWRRPAPEQRMRGRASPAVACTTCRSRASLGRGI